MSSKTARETRLKALFNSVIRGEKPLGGTATLFLEAITAQPNAPSCITSLIGNPKGLSSLTDALQVDTSPAFMNKTITDLVSYLRSPELRTLSNGDYLAKVIQAMVDASAFFQEYIRTFRTDLLQENAQVCFGWFLLQLLMLPLDADGKDSYRPIAEEPDVLRRIKSLPTQEGQQIAQKIERIIITHTVVQPEVGFSPGGRHDNDFADFRQINIMPTAQEIMCKERPFLRPSDVVEDPSTEGTRVSLYLDNQFRLLREDMLYEMREELQMLSDGKKGKGRRGMTVEGLSVVGAYCGPEGKRTQWGLALQCKEDLPQLKGLDGKKRKEYFTDNVHGKKLLRHQSLACLLADGEVVAFPIIYREEDYLAKKPPVIIVQISGQLNVKHVLLRLKDAQNLKLVLIDTAVFSYEPVLKALQTMRDLPLSEQILFWKDGASPQHVVHAPELNGIIRDIERYPLQDLKSYLKTTNSIKLDNAQSASLLAGLRQSVSLIQGPPGTGKSFIGALLAKFVHDYTEQKILVVCYTNHALDQFLGDLKQIGIPPESIVRLGGKFNPDTESMTLRNQKPISRFGKADYAIIDGYKSDAGIHCDSLEEHFKRYQAASVHDAEILAHIEFEDPEYFDALQVPSNDSGMNMVGRKGKAVDEYYLLQQWSQNKDPGIFKSHPQVGGNPAKAKVWTMSQSARNAQLSKWRSDILKYIIDEVYDAAKLYDYTQLQLQRKFSERDISVLQAKRIIGCTTTGAAKYKEIIQAASPDVLLVEEAGEILESHVITALSTEAKQMILIGDHKQLRPKVNHYQLTYEKGEGYDLNVSLFERLVKKGYPHQALEQQHRMRPEISALIRALTYPGLRDASRTSGRPDLRGVVDNIVFINHSQPEDETKQLADRRDSGSKTSKQNPHEVQMVLAIVRYLLQQGYKSEELVILTPYLGQLHLLQAELRKAPETDALFNELDFNELLRAGVLPSTAPDVKKKGKKTAIRLATIDNYQGEESDIVIASLCRSNSDNDIGFMFSPERLNVLLSRARNSLILIGNSHTFTSSKKGGDLWKKLLQLLRDGKHVYDGFPAVCQRHPQRKVILKDPGAFRLECPDGGCTQACGAKLSCGIHECSFKCHPVVINHREIKCQVIVQDPCALNHKRSRKCSEPPAPYCKKCAQEAELAEAERRRQHELQEIRERQQLEHDKRLKDLEARILAEQEKIKDAELAQQRAEILRQKQADLEAAKSQATSFMSRGALFASGFMPQSPPAPSPAQAQTTPNAQHNAPSSNSASSRSRSSPGFNPTNTTNPQNQSPQATSVPPPRSQTPPGNPATSNMSSPEAEWQRQKVVEGAVSPPIDAIMQMTGLEEVKRQMLRIKDKVDVVKRQNASILEERFNIVLLGNPGTGKTTVARQYAKFLTSNQIVSGHAFEETTGARLAYEGVAGIEKLLNTVVNAGGGAIFVDEAYQLTGSGNSSSHHGSQVLDFMLAEMENRRGQVVFILAGYAKQMEKFFEHNPGIPSRVPYRMTFADYTDIELRTMLERRIWKKYHGQMKAEDGLQGLYIRIAVRRLGRGRGKEGFGNARALENMLDKITERQAERINRERRQGSYPDDFLLTKEDIIGPDPSKALKKSSAWDELQRLIGLRSVKDSVRNLVDLLAVNYARELKEQEPMQVALNRVFLGSPGTGKTTVGKLYGQILVDIGMLSNGEVITKNPSDFKGAYIGHSETNTKKILASTVGKVLIIDEAYMLYGGGGTHSRTDSFNTAIIDTIVAEVHNVPGEDRCILLLGYENKMREMFQNVNEGFSRRFAIEDPFKFEDFTETELMQILDLKMKKQDLAASDHAKRVAMDVLAREKKRPNFGNGGAVENLLSTAKTRYMARIRGISPPPPDVLFEPQDFDPEYDRHLHASQNLDKLFEDVVGCDDIVNKLRDYQKVARVKKARGEDPRDVIPTNFIFKGPPGTGKTTTARKLGQVYYDMGFLSSVEVIECSASDLVGQYVGHTGPKTTKQFEKALGKVLFIDEAYRLGTGDRFAQEAVDEIVGLLTNETFKGKLIVVLAGYDADMNRLMSMNSGLSSRFPEVIQFMHFKPPACLEILDKKLRKDKVILADLRVSSSQGYGLMTSIVEDLSGLPGWGNAREMETLAKQMYQHVLKHMPDDPSSQPAELTIQSADAIQIMMDMLDEMRSRSNAPRMPRSRSSGLPTASASFTPPPPPQAASSSTASTPPAKPTTPPPKAPTPPPTAPPKATTPPPKAPPPQQKQKQPPPKPKNQPPRPPSVASTTVSVSSSRDNSNNPPPGPSTIAPVAPTPADGRDAGVSDDVWNQLQASKKAVADAKKKMQTEINDAVKKRKQAEKEEEVKARALEAARKAEQEARDTAMALELKKKRELAEKEERAAKERLQKLADALKAKREEERRKKQEEERLQRKLKVIGKCPQGYAWYPYGSGYRCRGGAHFVSSAQLGL